MRIMRAKLRKVRTRALAVPMKKLRVRTQALVAFLAILGATASPGIANASTSAIVSHHGTWSITTPFTFTQSNAKFTTHTTVSGCVNATSLQGTLGWHFRLIWYDGGKNKVLWTSREFSNVGRHCSVTVRLHTHLPKVYSQETLNCHNPIPLPCEAKGSWSLKTN